MGQMMGRIELIGDESLFQPSSPRPAVVQVTTRDGASFEERVTSSRGTPENPMSDEEVEKKALALIAPVLGDNRASQLIEKIGVLESASTVRDISRAWKKDSRVRSA